MKQEAFLFSGSETWNNTSELNKLLSKGFRVVMMSEPQVVNNKMVVLVIAERVCDFDCDSDCEEEATE